MRTIVVFLLMVLLTLAGRAATPTDSDAKLKALLDLWRQAVATKTQAGQADSQDAAALNGKVASMDLATLEDHVAALVGTAGNDHAVRAAALDYVDAVRAEREALAAKERATLEDLLIKLGPTCLAARHPADLDSTLAAFAGYAQDNPNPALHEPDIWKRGQNARLFATRWQDYLTHLEKAQYYDADQNLKELADNLDDGIMPRSKILALMPSETASAAKAEDASNPFLIASDLVDKLKSLDDLPDTVKSIHRLQLAAGGSHGGSRPPSGPGDHSVDNLLEPLDAMLKAYRDVQAGATVDKLLTEEKSQFVFPSFDQRFTDSTRQKLATLNNELVLMATAKFLRVPANLSPKPGEAPHDYLDRVIAESVKAGNFELAGSTLELWRGQFAREPPAWLTTEVEACKIQLVARNMEAVGDYTKALALNLRLLRLASKYVVPELVAKKVKDLRQAHPEVDQEATDIASSADRVRSLLN